MNNPLTDAIQGLQDAAKGVAAGTNPLIAPQLTNLFGFTVPGIPLISARDFFLLQMESWLTSIPLKTQWLVVIQGYPAALKTQTLQALELTGGNIHNYDINTAVRILKSFPLNKIVGCVFAQGVGIPENETTNTFFTENQFNRGFLNGLISNGRSSYDGGLQINFMETNTSFVDFVVRPWVILADHYGYVARPPSESEKDVSTTITILQYTRSYQKLSMIPRKIWTFYNCYPTSVGSRELTYDGEAMDTFPVTWKYSNYAVQNTLYLPLPDIITRISQIASNPRGNLPRVSPLLEQGAQILPRIPL